MCDALKLSKSELDKQPALWVKEMMVYLSVKGEAEAHKQKVEASRNKANKNSTPSGKPHRVRKR